MVSEGSILQPSLVSIRHFFKVGNSELGCVLHFIVGALDTVVSRLLEVLTLESDNCDECAVDQVPEYVEVKEEIIEEVKIKLRF